MKIGQYLMKLRQSINQSISQSVNQALFLPTYSLLHIGITKTEIDRTRT